MKMRRSIPFKEFMEKMQLIGDIYGEENITIANYISDLIRVNDSTIIDIEKFDIEKYIKELNEAKQTTLARLQRINKRLDNAYKIQEIKKVIDK